MFNVNHLRMYPYSATLRPSFLADDDEYDVANISGVKIDTMS
jgi:hypothetical protein